MILFTGTTFHTGTAFGRFGCTWGRWFGIGRRAGASGMAGFFLFFRRTWRGRGYETRWFFIQARNPALGNQFPKVAKFILGFLCRHGRRGWGWGR